MNPEFSMEEVDQIIAECGAGGDALLPILHALQRRFRYLPEEALRRVAETAGISAAAVHSTATFYPHFRLRPAGRHIISVCDGTACHLKGSLAVNDAIAEELGLGPDEDTDSGGLFTLQKVRCLGCCTLAPAVQIGRVTYGHVRPGGVAAMLDDYLAHAEQHEQGLPGGGAEAPEDGPEIRVGLGSCCVAGGSEEVRRALEETRARYRINVRIKQVGCIGVCHLTPLMEVVLPGGASHTYAKVRPEDVPSLVLAHFPPPRPVEKARARVFSWLERLYTDREDRPLERHAGAPGASVVEDYVGVQRRIATEHSGESDPTDLAEYIRHGGFSALRRCLAPLGGPAPGAGDGPPLDAPAIIDEIMRAGLRGRGGAGFPTARKWLEVRNAPGGEKYVICNGDEGDPGAFMDRMILESYTHRVLEGMLIASVAAGARRGIFYIRAEYPLAVARVRAAIDRCAAAGLLGDRVLGSSHAFHAEVREGAGAFVCGEETALIASLEGVRPVPRIRPPFPAHRGFHGMPTLVNNVETLAMVPWIIRNGAGAFAALGTEGSKGTKVFSLAGKIRRGGLIEVPMGMTVRRIVEEVGGGVADGRAFKAVQVGGPSGGCIPAAMGDLPVDYEALAGAGSMMGSGGFVVMDDADCMVEMTRYFLSFTQLESCGKCVPCRVGTRQLLEILERLCAGRGTPEDLAELERLAHAVKKQSLCGLGRTAPNPVLTGLAHFREEFEAHARGKCPAKKCKALLSYTITEDCIGCTKCAQRCPSGAIAHAPHGVHVVEMEKCVRCNACFEVCPVNAVRVD